MAVIDYPIRVAARAAAEPQPAVRLVRYYFVLLFALCLVTMVVGVQNRMTTGGLFNVRPPVDWMPPLSEPQWWTAFTLHQQDPAFSACGGTESPSEFRTLYWWEWSRQISTVALAVTAALGLYCAFFWRPVQFALRRMAGLGLAVAAIWGARALVDVIVAHVEAMSSFNVGQYRHAVDVTGASVIAALVLAAAIAPPDPASRARGDGGRAWSQEWWWLGLIVLDIGFGAMFAARDAAAAWTTWPGYQGHVLPPLDQLLSYAPVWLNFTFNQYMIQLVHRTLSAGLWIAALWQLVAAVARALPMRLAVVRFALITAQMLTGIATLAWGVPEILSLVHQLGSVLLLACSFVVLLGDSAAAAPRIGSLKTA